MDQWKSAKGKTAAWWKQAPASIKAAVVLLSAIWAVYATFIWSLQRTIPVPTSTHPVIGLLTAFLIEAFLLAQLSFGIYVIALIGRKRAIGRLVVIVAFLGLCAFRITHSAKLHVNTGTAMLLMLGAASALLFTHESRVWFRSRGSPLGGAAVPIFCNRPGRSVNVGPQIDDNCACQPTAAAASSRLGVPILNSDTPAATKIAALVFLISYCMSLHFLAGVTHGTYLLSMRHFSISPQMSADTLRSITLYSVAALAVWALVKGFLIAKLFFRRRWGKNVLSVVTLLILFIILLTHLMQPENASMTLSNNFEHIAEVVAVILLFTPKSTTWFRFKG